MTILESFLSNDVSVAHATLHLTADLDRGALLEARLKASAATIEKARAVLEGVPSALAREAFLARPLARKGRHAEALAARLEALPHTPRWDPFQSGLMLAGVARSLLALGRAEEALPVAREAARHAPLDPHGARAFVDAARAAGLLAEAAPVAACLRDAGFGAPIVEGPSGPGEAEAEAAPLPITDSAPLDAEGMARFLTLAEVDEGFESKRWRMVRHAMALIRFGEVGLARNVAAGDDGDSGLATVLAGWMNLAPPDELAWLTQAAMRRALERTRAGAEAKTGAGSRKPNRLWSWDAITHIGYRGQLLKTGRPEDGEALLYSPARAAFVDALAALPEHPVVLRFKALRAELHACFPPALPNQVNRGARATLGRDGRPVEFPGHDRIDEAEMPPRLEPAEDGRGRCKACKAAIAAGALTLAVGKLSPADGEAKWKRFHLACAADQPKEHAALRAAIARERRRSPEIEAIAGRLGVV